MRLVSKRGANPAGFKRAQACRAVAINWAYGTSTTVRWGANARAAIHSPNALMRASQARSTGCGVIETTEAGGPGMGGDIEAGGFLSQW